MFESIRRILPGDHGVVNDRRVVRDPMSSIPPAKAGSRDDPHRVAIPDPIRWLIASEIEAAHSRGALDEGTLDFQDSWIESHISGWYAQRWAENQDNTRVSEKLFAEAIRERTVALERAVDLLCEIDFLELSRSRSEAVLNGRTPDEGPGELDSRAEVRRRVIALAGGSQLAQIPRANMAPAGQSEGVAAPRREAHDGRNIVHLHHPLANDPPIEETGLQR